MIIVRLSGGLGNQMAQYAFGRATALRLSTKLYLDLNGLEKENEDYTFRKFMLDRFNLGFCNIANDEFLDSFLKTSLIERLKNRLKPAHERKFVFESSKNLILIS